MTLLPPVKSARPTIKESPEAKQQRLANQKAQKEERQDHRRLRKEDEKRALIELTNTFRFFGVDYLTFGQYSYDRLREIWEDQRVDNRVFPDEMKKFLHDNFRVEYRKDDFGHTRINFRALQYFPANPERANVPDSLLRRLIKESGQPYSVVNSVYNALVTLCKKGLTKKHRFTLPTLGRFSIRYMSASAEHTGRNPKTGEALTIPAKPAHNRVRFSPAKELKLWAQDLEVVAPVKKRKHKEEKKRKHRKKFKSHFSEQKHFHIA
jgi:nucleoid DNA-binding protein